MDSGLSLREAAARVGVSNPAILKAANAGRIKRTDDGKIDAASLDAWAAGRRAPRGGDPRGSRAPAAAKASADGEAAEMAREAIEAMLAGGVYTTRAEAELARDGFIANIKRLEYERLRGSLLSREGVRAAVAKAGAQIRTRLLALPSEIAPALHRLKLVAEVETALRDAIIEALEALTTELSASA